jgi:hypothetical protein
MKTTIHYSVQNHGDGSAYPHWFESESLADIDQEYLDEGWGESCTGSITIEHDGPIKIVDPIVTVDEVIAEVEEELRQAWRSANHKEYSKKKLEALMKLKEKQNA